jgi:hypothetical protein
LHYGGTRVKNGTGWGDASLLWGLHLLFESVATWIFPSFIS